MLLERVPYWIMHHGASMVVYYSLLLWPTPIDDLV
jgi:hypothetical protein